MADPPVPPLSQRDKVETLIKNVAAEIFLAGAMLEIEEPYARGRLDELRWVNDQIETLWPNPPPPAGVPVNQLRAMIRLLGPDELTPVASRQLESLCAQLDDGEPDPLLVMAATLRNLLVVERDTARGMEPNPYVHGRIGAYDFAIRAIDDRWPDLPGTFDEMPGGEPYRTGREPPLERWIDVQIEGIKRSSMVEASRGALNAFEAVKRFLAEQQPPKPT